MIDSLPRTRIDLSGRKLIICEERLRDLHGHFFEWDRAVREMNLAAGADVRVYAHREACPIVRRDLNAIPHFHDTMFDAPENRLGTLAWPLRLVTYTFRAYRQGLQALRHSAPPDAVFIATTRIHQLIAWRLICSRGLGLPVRRLAFFFILGQGRYTGYNPTPIFPRRARLFRDALRSFRRMANPERAMFCTDSDQTAKEYTMLSGVPFVEIPCPRKCPPAPRRPARPLVKIVSLGPPRAEKGSEELVQAIEILRRTPLSRPVNFVVHWPCDFRDETGRPVVIPEDWNTDPRLTVIREYLGSEEYDRQLMDADCVLLPYRWSTYFNRISGVVVEAASAGIPMVVTEGTWLDRAMQKYGWGLAARDGDARDVAQKLAELISNIDYHRDQARGRLPLAQSHHSHERFLRLLWGLS
jgi:glycosyltransferase involved in cell wall biosynthesis